MAADPVVHLHLDLTHTGGTLCGEVRVDGAPVRAFTGWIGLTAAIDALLEEGIGELGPNPVRGTHREEPAMSTHTSEPIVIGPITVTFTVEAEHSNGSVTVSRCDVAAGAGMPVAHSHDLFEETLYGVEGVTTVVLDGETVSLGPGDTVCIPRGAVHTFSADDGDASFLAIATPGLFGPAYFHELKAVVEEGGGGPPDPEAVMAVMHRHGLTPALPGR